MIRLRGRLDAAALGKALDALVARHESLRTTFVLEDAEPAQRIVPAEDAQFSLTLVERNDVPPSERQAVAVAIATDAARTPFDLARGPLAYGILVRFAEDDAALVLAFHHIITDRWSGGVLRRELSAFYRRATDGTSIDDLPPLAVQPADVANWERERFESGALDAGLSYWTERLADAPAPVAFPSGRIASRTERGPAHRVSARFSAELTANVRTFCRRHRVTPFMLLIAAYAVLLHRYSGADDLVIGSPVAGRSRLETHSMIGMFVNTLALRFALEPDATFADTLAHVRERVLEAFDHQDIAFEKIVEALHPERTCDATPFFDVVFAMQNGPAGALALAEIAGEHTNVSAGLAKFDVTVMIEETAEDDLSCTFEFDSARFDRVAMMRSFGHYTTLLDAILANPVQPIGALPMISTAEREELVVRRNDTARPFPSDTGLADVFAASVAAWGEATAVRLGDSSLTYSQLDARSSALAHRLRDAGVTVGTTVGVFLDLSLERIVALVAIVKAGGAYVPLDPAHPVERISAILGDCDARIVVTHGPPAERLGEFGMALCLIDPRPALAESAERNDPVVPCRGDDLFCIIATSGSTGLPKSVEILHRCAARMLCNTDYVTFRAGDVVTQSANFAFDAATFEIWGALLHGGTVVLVPPEVVLDPNEYAEMLRRERVNITFLTPTLFNAIARSVPAAFGTVRDVFIGGEALDPSAVRLVLQSGAPPQRLINGYGPTEVTTWSTIFVVDELSTDARSIPIGRPIGNTTAYVVDARGDVVPIGVPGELLLGGPGVARGYRGKPELTAERFIPDRFTDEPRARLYRTGDIVRVLDDGNLDYLGRRDRQVKIRGFRVELGEIEAVLASHPALAACAVVARCAGTDSASTVLVAYIVSRPAAAQSEVDGDSLRAFLGRRLPPYMLPAVFVTLDAMPIGPNGKLDHAALPEPAITVRDSSVAPRTALEVELAAIWEELLGVHPIGVDDDFFARGGHSLLAVRMLSRVESATGARLPLRTLFERPTIASLAGAVAESVPARRYTALRTFGERPPFFLFHGYLDGGFYAVDLARLAGADRAFIALHPHDADGAREAIPPTIEAMAEDHVRIIRELMPHGPYYLGGFCNGARVAYEVALRLRDAGEQVPLLTIFTTPPPARGRRLRELVADWGRLRGLHPLEEVRAFLRWQARLAMLSSPRALAARIAQFAQRQPDGVGGSGAVPDDVEKNDRWYAYVDRISRYVPRRRFDGRIALIWGRDAATPNGDPRRSWRRWCDRVDVYGVPGRTTTSLTEYPADVAKALRTAFERADADLPS